MLDPITPGALLGIVGLGRMGLPMAECLAAAGYRLIGYDLSRDARDAFVAATGGQVAEAPSHVACGASAVILMLPTSDIVEQTLWTEGLLSAVRSGGVVVDMGSSDPIRTRSFAARTAEHGVTLIDAPVSGGVAGARAGALTVIVGGPETTVTACEPFLSVLGCRIFRVGEVGAGHAVKALNNLLSATSLLAASEALSIARTFGVDPALMLDVVNASSGRSGSTEVKFPRFVLPGSYDSGFAMALMVKDVQTALNLGDTLGIRTNLSDEALHVWQLASRDLSADADHTEIARWIDGELTSSSNAGARNEQRVDET